METVEPTKPGTRESLKVLKKILNVKSKLGVLTKNKVNPFTKSKYCTLSNVFKHITPVMQEEGLLVEIPFILDQVEGKSAKYSCPVIISDVESGDQVMREYQIPVGKDISGPKANQEFGATATYVQRYIYGILFSIAFDEEDPDNRPAQSYNRPAASSAPSTPAKGNFATGDAGKKQWTGPPVKQWLNTPAEIGEELKRTYMEYEDPDEIYQALRKDGFGCKGGKAVIPMIASWIGKKNASNSEDESRASFEEI